ncbi:TetR/AcrR family transcriptional regulator [Sphingobacterium chungjuense]|uniref:TetR/AcrR family transcriptional regulator n=1 Tax=Sphingobacterium chungjuense TaxID=2675553 RepID=UPI00140E1F1B|nr:TetR/AcrR family transcriptional regulator [Sphingobacterium chungjuense]
MSETRKEEIVEAALKRFSHFGIQKTTMNEIADDLRITKANLYYYYTDKSTLLGDCVRSVMTEMSDREHEIIQANEGGLLGTLFSLFELHNNYSKDYYMLSLYEKVEIIRELSMQCMVQEFDQRNIKNLRILFQRAIDTKELILTDLEMATSAFHEIIKGLSMFHRISDIITGIPNIDNTEKILVSQKRAARFILEGKLTSK